MCRGCCSRAQESSFAARTASARRRCVIQRCSDGLILRDVRSVHLPGLRLQSRAPPRRRRPRPRRRSLGVANRSAVKANHPGSAREGLLDPLAGEVVDTAPRALSRFASSQRRPRQRTSLGSEREKRLGGPLRIEVAGETNVGMKRTHNEDNFSILEESGLYIVADGMGGHASGEVAAKMAVDSLKEFFAATANDPERTWPYKMDRSQGVRGEPAHHRHQAREPAHLRERAAGPAAARDGDDDRDDVRGRGRRVHRARGRLAHLPRARRARSSSSPRTTRCSTTTSR